MRMSDTSPGGLHQARASARAIIEELLRSIRKHAQHARWHRVSSELLAELATSASQSVLRYEPAQPPEPASQDLLEEYLRFTSLLHSIDVAVKKRHRIMDRLRHTTDEDLGCLSKQLLEFHEYFKTKYINPTRDSFVGAPPNDPVRQHFPLQVLNQLLDGQDKLLGLLQMSRANEPIALDHHTIFLHPTFNDVGGNQFVTNNS
ncbi:hypothetical protein HGRIS_010909 [Hohenbuehelia grisea]|uniref:Uncharacterized protein n=1 Tax=Hohenbuehelia grisea TaxID=104357 RepID=A0ABR3IY67_9AGAR